VGKQSVVLENHTDVPSVRRRTDDITAIDLDATGGRREKAGEGPE
jgi:hypothetical protein